jgi:outer membrane lipoprotein-sorting protein
MKKILLLTFIISISLLSISQDADKYTHDPEAKKILDNLSAKMSKYQTARFYFKYTLNNAQDSTTQVYYGYLYVKDSTKYKVLVPDQEFFSDGIKTYNYNKKANEMNITFVDPKKDAVYTPQNMINIYKKGFKYSYRGDISFDAEIKKDGKVTKQNKNCYIVDLYPEKPKDSPFSIIRIWIDKDKNELVSIRYQQNNGIEQIVDILKSDFDVKIDDKIFTFDKSLYPADIDVIDFTE